MKSIAYTSPYVPPEWVAAHGLEPIRLIPSQDGIPAGPVKPLEGTCPFMRLFTNAAAAMHPAGIVLTTVCDQMRHAKDVLDHGTNIPSFLMNVPSVWQTSSSQALYRNELHRLGCFLESVGGHAPSKAQLVETLERYDQARADHQTIRPPHSGPRGISIALLGGPLTEADQELYRLVAEAGGRIVLDGIEGNERTQPGRFDRLRLREDPMAQMVSAYFDTIPDVFRRPNTALFTWLQREVAARGVRGVILARQVWCDQWHAETHRLRAALPVPLLDVDLDGEPCGSRTRVRIQAFMESLQ